jgi:hypothetical protein
MRAMAILAFLGVLGLLLPGALGATYTYCADNTTLLKIREVQIAVQQTNKTRTFNVTESETCAWGCQNNECMQPPWIAYAIGLGILIIMLIVYLVLRPR